MSDAKLQIDITANTDAAVANIKGLNTALANTEKAAAVGAKGMQTFNKATGTSTQALTNLNRVVQDAPFGIIGIANNIEPLVQSFQKLKAESGGTGGALKALAGSLAGPGGLLFGISALTTAFIAFGPQIANFFSGVEGASQTTEKYKEEVGKASASLQVLGAVLKNSNSSLSEKKAAISELRKDFGPYLKDLSDEAILSDNGARAIALAAQAIIARARAREFEAKISTNVQKQLENEERIARNQVAIKNLEIQQTQKSAQAQKSLGAGYDLAAASALGSGLSVVRLTNEQKELEAQNQRLQQENANFATQVAQLTSADLKQADAKNRVSIATRRQAQETKNLNDEKSNELNITRQLTAFRPTAEEQQIIINEQRERQKQTDAIRAQIEARKQLAAIVNQGVQQPSDLGQKGLPAFVKESADALNKLKDQTILENIAQSAQNAQAAFSLLSPTIDAAFNSLANGTNVADAVGQAIKQLIINLIKAVAQAALLSLIFSLLPGGQAAAAAKGGFGGILKNLLGFGGRAIGGPVSGGQGYIVGENGPELFVPGTPGSIVPNMALAGGGGGNVSFEIRGDVLYGLLRRTANNKMANFG